MKNHDTSKLMVKIWSESQQARWIRPSMAIWTEATRKQLEELARDGHVIARYIYATWAPQWALGPESFGQFTEYQTNALEFSFANLKEGEIAGLLAFGLSYWGPHFTPFFPDLGTAFMKAALDCGLQSKIIENRVYHNAEDESGEGLHLRVWYDGGKPEAVLALSKEFAEICR